MSADYRELVERLIRAFEAKDLEVALACFADDALLFDPHYPTPEMHGKAAIRQGFEFIFGIVQQPGFTIRHFWAGDQDGALEKAWSSSTNAILLGRRKGASTYETP